MRILGYAFNSAACCPACTNIAFENGELIRAKPPAGKTRRPVRYDQHRLPDDMTNTNYEPVTPIFADAAADGITCDDCGEVIL